MKFSMLTAALLGTVMGALGGGACVAIGNASLLSGPIAGGLYGLLFVLLFARRATNAGAGLIWGLGYSFLLWLTFAAGVFPILQGHVHSMGMLDAARAHFPELIAYIVFFGMPLGIVFGTAGSLWLKPNQGRFSLARAL